MSNSLFKKGSDKVDKVLCCLKVTGMGEAEVLWHQNFHLKVLCACDRDLEDMSESPDKLFFGPSRLLAEVTRCNVLPHALLP